MAGDRQSVAFLFCVEAGPLEAQSTLLVRSIRRWAGGYADAEIHGFRPRVGPPLGPDTYSALEGFGVVMHEEPINTAYHDYVHINTTYAMLWAEQHLDAEIVVWCDSDKVFLSDPVAFDLPAGIDAAGTGPYYRGSVDGPKSTGPDCEFDPYWQRMYELAGVTDEPFVTAPVDGARLRAFWNGGLIVFRRRVGLAREWLSLFELLLDADHVPKAGMLNVDQLSLAATLSRRPEAVETLDHRHNHNLALRARLPEPMRSWELADLVSVHYHSWFNRTRFLDELRPPLARDTERYRWLSGHLPLQPEHTKPIPGIGRSRPAGRRRGRRLQGLRRRLRRRLRS